MPDPTSIPELRAFLGQIQFYGKFLPNLATVLEPLYNLTRKDSCWKSGAEEQAPFQQVKDWLCTDAVLAHFDPSLDIGISCDASDCGIDHKPLLNIFSPHKATPVLAANRPARWAVTLSQYDYSTEYRQSSKHGNADALSRLPSGPDTAFDEREGDADMDSVYTVRIISTLIQEWWPEKAPKMQLSRRS
ncbi:hypothetical protein RRG08_012622 [Elysia crispata]|uniref:Reverse transcriptase/retrotransposon-derived protein RNase H-like domain-containing protein n=1 Tax=Elysia crispata TaxID=231223 RepID=A0AAE1DWA1_9GAST|nr:hypothetical protein RRG08_012622 [Elysia crispata]